MPRPFEGLWARAPGHGLASAQNSVALLEQQKGRHASGGVLRNVVCGVGNAPWPRPGPIEMLRIETLDEQGFEPWASRMRSGRSTTELRAPHAAGAASVCIELLKWSPVFQILVQRLYIPDVCIRTSGEGLLVFVGVPLTPIMVGPRGTNAGLQLRQ